VEWILLGDSPFSRGGGHVTSAAAALRAVGIVTAAAATVAAATSAAAALRAVGIVIAAAVATVAAAAVDVACSSLIHDSIRSGGACSGQVLLLRAPELERDGT
jgi:hypothetical protein